MASTLFALCRIIWALCLMVVGVSVLLILMAVAVACIWGLVKLMIQKVRETDLHG